jgi:hypothetical protein
VLRIYDLWGQGPTVAAEVRARTHTHTQHTHSLPSLSLPQPHYAVLECMMKTTSSRNAFLVCAWVCAFVRLSLSVMCECITQIECPGRHMSGVSVHPTLVTSCLVPPPSCLCYATVACTPSLYLSPPTLARSLSVSHPHPCSSRPLCLPFITLTPSHVVPTSLSWQGAWVRACTTCRPHKASLMMTLRKINCLVMMFPPFSRLSLSFSLHAHTYTHRDTYTHAHYHTCRTHTH